MTLLFTTLYIHFSLCIMHIINFILIFMLIVLVVVILVVIFFIIIIFLVSSPLLRSLPNHDLRVRGHRIRYVLIELSTVWVFSRFLFFDGRDTLNELILPQVVATLARVILLGVLIGCNNLLPHSFLLQQIFTFLVFLGEIEFQVVTAHCPFRPFFKRF